jgi:hypothetical protein
MYACRKVKINVFINHNLKGDSMKKMMIILAAVILTVTLNTDAFAQNGKKLQKKLQTNWVDADGDGVCDNNTGAPKRLNQNNPSAPNFVDADGDGVCDNAGNPQGKGKRLNFVDADGDGVCDNAGSAVRQRLMDGSGAGEGSKTGLRKRGKK